MMALFSVKHYMSGLELCINAGVGFYSDYITEASGRVMLI